MLIAKDVLQLTTTVTVSFDDAATIDFVKRARLVLQHAFQGVMMKGLKDLDGGEYSSISVDHKVELVRKDWD